MADRNIEKINPYALPSLQIISTLSPIFSHLALSHPIIINSMNIERKLIQLFRTFVDKALTPQIKKADGSLAEWNKFSALLSADTLNYSELQLYVDTLPAVGGFTAQKPNLFKKRQESEGPEFGAFNPSKTFGGERNKPNIFQEENGRDNHREDSGRHKNNQNSQGILLGLDKLLKSLEENQKILEGLSKQSGVSTTPSNTHSTNNINASKPNGRESLPYTGGGGYLNSHSSSSYGYQQQQQGSQPGYPKGYY